MRCVQHSLIIRVQSEERSEIWKIKKKLDLFLLLTSTLKKKKKEEKKDAQKNDKFFFLNSDLCFFFCQRIIKWADEMS